MAARAHLKKEACLNGHPRMPENVYPNGMCRICRGYTEAWRHRGRVLKDDLAWARALAPETELSYDQWVRALATVFFLQPVIVRRVVLLPNHTLEQELLRRRSLGVDSLGQPVHASEIWGLM